MGDFVGLDDVFTENPRVVQGMIDIYGALDRQLRRRRIPHRHRAARQPGVLAEVRSGDARRARAHEASRTSTSSAKSRRSDMDPAHTAVNTRVDKLPSVLDFAFLRTRSSTSWRRMRGTDELAKLFRADALYEGGAEAALRLPTFIGNHDCRALRLVHPQRTPERQRRRSAEARDARQRHAADAARRADHLLRRRAGLRRQRRRPGCAAGHVRFARSRATTRTS